MTKSQLKVVVAEDETLFRDFLVRIISQRFGFEIIGEVATGEEAYRLCNDHHPDLVILDLRLPGITGQELAERLIEEQPDVKILIISSVEDQKRIGSLLQMGVTGFLNKKEEFSVFEQAIEAVANGNIFVKASAQTVSDSPDVLDQKELLETLSDREKQIVVFVASGMTNKEIAQELGLSIKTVESHRSNIAKKLKIFDIAGVTLFAVRTGLVTL
ncbi:response regulator transcription factor [Pelagicoccus sp. SDUM812003]|uniref:response regulator transcription factor n=1 Tax=Pelagicoccus sp. SDUM812003 TaxID=3041267 RepID=UPI00281039D6|nr:response regulator transcription factor [Pelagicoccus sp. SDUM812003]MDQ8203627.1 response regulator transcription factor [Pelagicoccus sp. SDUM812003]